jgi:hypothetical protein
LSLIAGAASSITNEKITTVNFAKTCVFFIKPPSLLVENKEEVLL